MAANGFDTRQLDGLIRQLGRVATNSETEFKRVLIGAKRASETESKRAITERYNVRGNRVARDLRVRTDNTRLSIGITGGGRKLSAAEFSGRSTRQGYRYRIRSGGATTTIKRGFVQPTVQVPLMRTSRSRLPIRAITGPSVGDMLEQPMIVRTIESKVGTRVIGDLSRRIIRGLR